MSDGEEQPRANGRTAATGGPSHAGSAWTRVRAFLRACAARLAAVDPTSPREPTFLARPATREEEDSDD
jgi:hypothetical protein